MFKNRSLIKKENSLAKKTSFGNEDCDSSHDRDFESSSTSINFCWNGGSRIGDYFLNHVKKKLDLEGVKKFLSENIKPIKISEKNIESQQCNYEMFAAQKFENSVDIDQNIPQAIWYSLKMIQKTKVFL